MMARDRSTPSLDKGSGRTDRVSPTSDFRRLSFEPAPIRRLRFPSFRRKQKTGIGHKSNRPCTRNLRGACYADT